MKVLGSFHLSSLPFSYLQFDFRWCAFTCIIWSYVFVLETVLTIEDKIVNSLTSSNH